MTSPKRPILLHVEPTDSADSAKATGANALVGGFDGVEISLPDVEESRPAPEAPANAGVIAAAATCRATDSTCGLTEVSTLIRSAATCRATCLNLTLPPIDGPRGGTGYSRYQDGLNFAYRVLYDLRFEAEAAGVTIALEATAGGGLLSPVELREIINQANSPAVGVCLDAASVSRVGNVEDWIATLAYRIKSVRVNLTDDCDLEPLADALNAVRFEGPVMVRGADDPQLLRACLVRLAGTAAG